MIHVCGLALLSYVCHAFALGRFSKCSVQNALITLTFLWVSDHRPAMTFSRQFATVVLTIEKAETHAAQAREVA